MILFVGATGQLGEIIARKLLYRVEKVRALVREGSDYHWIRESGGECAIGDLKDRASVFGAFDRIDRVVTTANSVRRRAPDTIESVDIQGTCNLIDAAARGGVERFLYVSAYGAALDSPSPLLSAKAYIEAYLRNSQVPYTIVRPNLFMDVWAENVVGKPAREGKGVWFAGDGQRRHAMVACADVAEIAVRALFDDDARCSTLQIGGPAAVSWNDVVNAYERALGHPIERAAQPDPMPETMLQLLRSLDQFDSTIDMSAIIARYGITLMTIDRFALM